MSTRRNTAAIGSRKNASVSPRARTSAMVNAERRMAYCSTGTPNPAAVRRARPVLPSTLRTNARAAASLSLDDTTQTAVLDGRLGARGHADDADLLAESRRIRAVDETGVGFAERDLGEDAAHVGLLADDVREHGARDAELAERRARVVADRHALLRDHDLEAGAAEVEDRLHVAGVRARIDDDQRVRREHKPAGRTGLPSAAPAGSYIGRGEDVCRCSLPDLLGERAGGGERVARALVDRREDVGERRCSEDRDPGSGVFGATCARAERRRRQ